MLCDAQTSGGLLAAVAPDQAEGMLAALRSAGVSAAAVIGEIESAPAGRMFVERSKT